MLRVFIFILLLAAPRILHAQQITDTLQPDSTDPKLLQEVMVKAYEQNRKLTNVGAAIGVVSHQQLERFANTSLLPAVNSVPGVRMEERSPGSYRLNIRGSSIRSPFGVRDVKIYFNEIPLTDPGGNTYLNQLGYYNIQSMEIIKGPAGSLYGAGIGGAVLINSLPRPWEKGATLDLLAGSYGLNGITGSVRFGDNTHQNNLMYSHQAAGGYRVQTNMRRDIVSFETQVSAGTKQTLHAYMLYSDLYYQTPGALTLKEYNTDPRQARPGTPTAPGAVQNKAAIYQKIFTVGLADTYRFGEHWQNTTAVYGAYTDFKNPGIRVYEARKEPHFGGRTVFQFNRDYGWSKLQFNMGAEAQQGFFNTKDYSNKNGLPDTLQTDDDINNWQYMIFAQADLRLHGGWTITAGASFNKSAVQFTRESSPPPLTQRRSFENKVAPRIAVLKELGKNISVYASASKGFSTPTVSELLKSSGTLGDNLQPEDGIDYEVGLKGNFLHERLYVDVNGFFFHLSNTIVQRIDTNGVFYYVNAGKTRQNGLEALVAYYVLDDARHWFSRLKVQAAYTYHDFHYEDFSQLSQNYSGNRLPGVAPQVLVGEADLDTRSGFYLNLSYTYSEKIALNDANTDYAGSFAIFGGRIGFRKSWIRARFRADLFFAGDNLFNTKYSLGNDINAAAGRYYNAAPTANYTVGLSLSRIFK